MTTQTPLHPTPEDSPHMKPPAAPPKPQPPEEPVPPVQAISDLSVLPLEVVQNIRPVNVAEEDSRFYPTPLRNNHVAPSVLYLPTTRRALYQQEVPLGSYQGELRTALQTLIDRSGTPEDPKTPMILCCLVGQKKNLAFSFVEPLRNPHVSESEQIRWGFLRCAEELESKEKICEKGAAIARMQIYRTSNEETLGTGITGKDLSFALQMQAIWDVPGHFDVHALPLTMVREGLVKIKEKTSDRPARWDCSIKSLLRVTLGA